MQSWKYKRSHAFSIVIIFTNPSARAGYDTRSIFKSSLTGLNSEPSLPFYLPIVGRRIIGFIPFPRVLVLCEMQSVSSRIWTRVAVSIPYDDNHYTTAFSRVIIRKLIWVCNWSFNSFMSRLRFSTLATTLLGLNPIMFINKIRGLLYIHQIRLVECFFFSFCFAFLVIFW